MEQIIALTRTLNLLASNRRDSDPTIVELLAAVPNLQTMDWINRFGPAREWERVASDIQTDALEWLTKALVIAEREFDWIGGSVAAPIWLYRAYATRVGAAADALANWVVRNRGRNDYVPFGRRTSARSVEEWRAEEKGRRLHREALRLMEEEQKSKDGALVQLRAVQGCQRLCLIARDTSLPLETIPPSLIVECFGAAHVLENETREALLRRIDRRQRRVWKSLRRVLVK